MSSRTLNRKDFLVVTVTAVSTSVLAACGDDATEPNTPSGGSGGTGGGTGGTPSGGGGTGGTPTGGTGGSTAGAGGKPSGGGGAGGGSGGGGAGGGGAGGGGAGGGGAGGGGAGGGGAGGGGGGGAGGGGGMCGTANIMHTSNNQHTHIPQDSTQLKMDLKAHINGNMATMAFTLPMDAGHPHTITLTANQVSMLKAGMMVTGVVSSNDSNHTHTYTLSCAN